MVATLKGWFFVTCTSALLYWVLREKADPPPRADAPAWQHRLGVGALIVALTLTALLYKLQQQEEIAGATLQAIAKLRAQQVSEWLEQRGVEASLPFSGPFLPEAYQRWRTRGDLPSRDLLLGQLEEIGRQGIFRGASLLDERGDILWHSGKLSAELDTAQRQSVGRLAREKPARQLGPYVDPTGLLRLDFPVPLASGSVILTSPLSDSWPASLLTWPVPSRSGEIVLVQPYEGSVLVLNKLRRSRQRWLSASQFDFEAALPQVLSLRRELSQGTAAARHQDENL